ncbi:MAG: penicillin-binding transpeptidase domain-containing protein [Chloroflexota bacterium]
MRIYHWVILWLCLLAVGCNSVTPSETVTPGITETPSATFVLPTPVQKTTPVPDADDAVRAYLDAWKADDYASMYIMLTSVGQDAITEEDFTNWYRTVATEAALSSVDYEILSSLVRNTRSAQANYRVILHSVLVGDIQRDTVMNLSLEDGTWRLQWSDDLIIPELAGGNYLWMDRHIPARANIYDREGTTIAAYAEAVSIGIIPGQIDPGTGDALLADLQWLTGMNPNVIAAMYEDFPPGAEWYLALGEVPLEKVQTRYDVSNGYNDNGLLMFPFESRFYFDNGIASQSIGYVSLIQVEEMEQYLRQGYNRDEKVGRQGIESWGESYLGGTRGGTLYVIGPDDQVVTQLADVAAKPSQAIYTSIDRDLQLAAQTALLKFRGAIVVLERDTGRVLAMASSPGYDPNAFEPSNYNYSYQLEDIYSAYSGQPLLNRATQGQYPLGSVFKIITLAAALESGSYTPQTTYDCQYDFAEISGIPPRHDWTWDHFQKDGKTQPSGMLTLPEGLMRSCNPFFWHIGLDLFNQGLTDAISGMARGFGLGSPTGIEGVGEQPGQIPDPGDGLEAINLAIGQGNTLVTPLQVARFVAAIGNGGTVYLPQIVERIVPPDEDAIYEFEPIIQGTLPISPETLKTIQDAMVSVVENRRGTAYHILGSFSQNYYSLAGKTGTAESGSGEPHAWFVGYTREGRDNKPDIVVVVIAENAGEGSDIAAPIFKGMVQYYFEGRRNLLPWEASVGVLATPEPEEE